MSDISIPGVTSKFNSDKTIQALVEAERAPLVRMENERQTSEEQKQVWLRLNNSIATLRGHAQRLYGFQNPFAEKRAESSNQASLSAIASRTAVEEERTVVIKQIAASDRFISSSLTEDFKPPKGLYRFQVGEEEVRFTFQGDSLRELVNTINQKAGDLLKATLVDDTKDTKVIGIEAKKTGAQNRLLFHDQATAFAEQAGILEHSTEALIAVPIELASMLPWEKPLPPEGFTVEEGVLTLNPGTELRIPLPETVRISENMVLELEIRTQIIPEEAPGPAGEPAGPSLPEVGGIEFQGLRIESSRSKVILPQREVPEPPERVDDLGVLFVSHRGTIQALESIQDTEEFYTLSADASKLPQRIDALNLRNRNTHRVIQIKNIRVVDQSVRGEYRPRQALSTAQDARITIDGIEVVRDSNNIDDLLPGVNLTLHGPSPEPIRVKIGRDTETIKDTIIRFIGNYNRLLTQIDILTRQDEAIVEEAEFLSEEERKEALEELGLFQGNLTLSQLKSSLQRFMMNPYPTRGGRELTLLAQAGIGTDAGTIRGATALDRTRLRGYLQIDEGKLDDHLNRHIDWVQDIFGYDTDRDLVVDSGVAHVVANYLAPYVKPGGIVNNRIATLETAISRKTREIEAYNRHLEDYERELKRKFGIMEGALETLEQSSRQIENFSRRNTE